MNGGTTNGGALIVAYNASATLLNVTISGNSMWGISSARGSAIDNTATILINSTIANNSSTILTGAVSTFTGYSTTVKNSIIAGNYQTGTLTRA
ncbi:MAG TPA: hypothetical protein VK970_04800 [Candidatus Methylacidiphilales bacterium]|nr:hypothetical protein [Candidatus Methylacidiphilales bacterium]